MISIIIPVYNVEKYLPQCVDSILAQTYTNFEAILVNDGSPDNSGAICEEYAKKDSRIRVIHQKNAGVSAARNNGIEQAKGEWISFIDSDDYVDWDYLENFHLKGNDSDIIIQGLDFYDHRNSQFFKQIKLQDTVVETVIFKQLIADNKVLSNGYPYAKAIKRDLIIGNNLRFDTSLSFHEDHIFVLQVLNLSHKIQLSSSTAYKYRCYHTTSSLSSKHHPWQNYNDAANGMIRQLDVLRNRFLESGREYRSEIYTFAYAPKISAVFDLFRTVVTSTGQKQNYNMIINKRALNQLYNPVSLKNKVLKSVMLYTPFCFIKAFFKIYIKYQDRHN